MQVHEIILQALHLLQRDPDDVYQSEGRNLAPTFILRDADRSGAARSSYPSYRDAWITVRTKWKQMFPVENPVPIGTVPPLYPLVIPEEHRIHIGRDLTCFECKLVFEACLEDLKVRQPVAVPLATEVTQQTTETG